MLGKHLYNLKYIHISFIEVLKNENYFISLIKILLKDNDFNILLKECYSPFKIKALRL